MEAIALGWGNGLGDPPGSVQPMRRNAWVLGSIRPIPPHPRPSRWRGRSTTSSKLADPSTVAREKKPPGGKMVQLANNPSGSASVSPPARIVSSRQARPQTQVVVRHARPVSLAVKRSGPTQKKRDPGTRNPIPPRPAGRSLVVFGSLLQESLDSPLEIRLGEGAHVLLRQAPCLVDEEARGRRLDIVECADRPGGVPPDEVRHLVNVHENPNQVLFVPRHVDAEDD